MHRFPTEQARLKVKNPAGEVRVEAAETSETTVELVALNDSDSTREAIDRAVVEARGEEIVVEVESRGWSFSIGDWAVGRNAKVGVRITCPAGSDLDCDTASANIKATGTLGTARARTASGDVSLERVGKKLYAKTASGDLSVEHVDGAAELHTVSGDVDIRTALGGAKVQSVSGDVELGEVTGSLSVTSVSGDQRVRAAGPGDLAFKAVSGDVEVAVRTGLRVRLDVNTVSGTLTSELAVSDAPSRSDGPEADLRARTVSGDVKIGRTQSSSDSASARIALA
jgi:Putative adhesin